MIALLAPLILFLSYFHDGDPAVAETGPGTWSKEIFEKANTARDEKYLNDQEKRVIFYTNLVRVNPKLFADTYLKNYLDSTSSLFRKKKYIASLYKDLEKASPSPILQPRKDLFLLAKRHSIDMGAHGKIGHMTSGGDPFTARIKELKDTYGFIYENCQYGYSDALSIVIDLLIDEDVEDLGHRKTVLNPTLKYAGVSIQPHKKFRVNCVIDYATEK